MALGPLPAPNVHLLGPDGRPAYAYAQYWLTLDKAVRSPTIATTSVAGVVKPDGTTITVAADGTITAIDTDVVLTTITNSLSGDVPLNNAANYFDGPSCAQGATGTWFASGTVTLVDTGAASFNVKLWDGTTVIASSRDAAAGGNNVSVSLSGVIASPAGNIRISANDPSSANGTMKFNATGNSKDSTLTVIRIA